MYSEDVWQQVPSERRLEFQPEDGMGIDHFASFRG